MCYVQKWVWTQCGHTWQGHLLCELARRRDPPSYCESAHWAELPHAVPLESEMRAGETAWCPDVARHPDIVGTAVVPPNMLPGTSITKTFTCDPKYSRTEANEATARAQAGSRLD